MDTSTSYLGFRLPHPFIAGASPFGYHLDDVRRLEDGGAAAIVLHSLFEEQITLARDQRIRHIEPSDRRFADALIEFPLEADYPQTPDWYAEHVFRIKKAVSVPVIGSLNGTTAQAWLTYAKVIEQAGADAIEIDLYEVVTDANVSGDSVEREWTRVVRNLKSLLRIPIAVKLSPFFTAFASVARQLDQAGADALVLFNRFYEPDIDIATMTPSPHLELSTSAELLLRLRRLAILHGRVRPALAATGGVATPADGIKALLAGADAVQLVSALLRHGPDFLGTMRRGLEQWMERHRFERLGEVRGLASLHRASDPSAYERANYLRTLHSWDWTAGLSTT